MARLSKEARLDSVGLKAEPAFCLPARFVFGLAPGDMGSVPGAVATGSQRADESRSRNQTRSLPLTSSRSQLLSGISA